MAKPAADAVKQVATTIRLVRQSPCQVSATPAVFLLAGPLRQKIINAGQAKPSPPVGPALGQVRRIVGTLLHFIPLVCSLVFFSGYGSFRASDLGVFATRLIRFGATGGSEHHGVLQGVQRAHARHQGKAHSLPLVLSIAPFLRCCAMSLFPRQEDVPLPVLVTAYKDKSFEFVRLAHHESSTSLTSSRHRCAGCEKPARHVFYQESGRRVAAVATALVARMSLSSFAVQASCLAARSQDIRPVARSR
jgi:ribosomal protein L11